MIDAKHTKCLYAFVMEMKEKQKEVFSQGCQKQMFDLVTALGEVVYDELETYKKNHRSLQK